MDLRDRVRSGLEFSTKEGVEIGPLCRPFVLKHEGAITYVDHVDTATLRDLHKDIPGFDISKIVEVDAIWGEQTLQQCIGESKKIDYVIASHVVEHVPDLITWLNEIKSILKSNGEIRLVIPDKRFSFDYTRRITEMSDILDAHLRRARIPLPRSVLDHHLNVRVVDAAAAWHGPLCESDLPHMSSFDYAVNLAKKSLTDGAYFDTHCWVFTPASFARLMCDAIEHDLINFSCSFFEDTIPGQLEFLAYLRPCDDKHESIESWRAMEREAEKSSPDHFPETLLSAGKKIASLSKENIDLKKIIEQMKISSENQAKDLLDRLSLLKASEEQAKKEVRAFETSTSWKVTEPLRKIARLLRR